MNEAPVLPWYKQFWPWLIIALPGSIVIASFGMLYLALSNPVSLVKDNYYEDGMAINQQLDRDITAVELGLRVRLEWDPLIGEISLHFLSPLAEAPQQVTLQLLHPTEHRQDRQIALRRVADQHYLASVEEGIAGRWYLDLSAAKPQAWRLRSEWLIAAAGEQLQQLEVDAVDALE